MTGQPPLRIELRGSPALSCLTYAAHATAAIILYAVLPSDAKWPAVGVLSVLALFAVRERTALTSPRAPNCLCLGRDGSVTVRLRSGLEEGTSAIARRYVNRWIVVLELENPARGRRTIIVARDMLAPEAFRRLRLWALWSRLPTPGAALPTRVKRTISADTCL